MIYVLFGNLTLPDNQLFFIFLCHGVKFIFSPPPEKKSSSASIFICFVARLPNHRKEKVFHSLHEINSFCFRLVALLFLFPIFNTRRKSDGKNCCKQTREKIFQFVYFVSIYLEINLFVEFPNFSCWQIFLDNMKNYENYKVA